MATFEAQIEGLTGLTIDSSSAPTQDEVTQFLNDGVIDITHRCITIDPNEKPNFSRESAEQTSNGFNPGTTDIIAVLYSDIMNIKKPEEMTCKSLIVH